MKVRIGFVSNSSSSSYVVMIPKSFNIRKADWDDALRHYKDVKKEEVLKLYKELKRTTHLWPTSEYEGGDVTALRTFYVLCHILQPFCIVRIQGSPEDPGQLKLLTNRKVKKLLQEGII